MQVSRLRCRKRRCLFHIPRQTAPHAARPALNAAPPGPPQPQRPLPTPCAQVQGFAARYEHLGDPQALLAVRHFFDLMLQVGWGRAGGG